MSSHMEELDLSDPDTEDLFASPSRAKTKSQKKRRSVAEAPQTPNSLFQTNAIPGQSKLDAEEAREVALRKELEGIRNINGVIEGVVDSLEKAKDNMDVCASYVTILHPWTLDFLSQSNSIGSLVCFPYRLQCLYIAPDLDSHPFPNRTQSTPYPQPLVAWRHSGYG